MINDVKYSALKDKVPIIKDEGLSFLLKTIRENNFSEILELGTAVGYSAMQMANLGPHIHVDTIEKNDDMYEKAINNIKDNGFDKQICVYHMPIEYFKTDKKYDLIFVDAAKAQYGKYLEMFVDNLKDNGKMFFDNMVFHGLIYKIEDIESKSLKNLVKKIVSFREMVHNDSRFDIIVKDDIGDGILILSRRDK